jgi:alkylation response protein AidB-like acyl-CoA dehydrogenase
MPAAAYERHYRVNSGISYGIAHCYDRSHQWPAPGTKKARKVSANNMTVVDSPEKILFASTTQAFLQKEVPLSRVRDLHAQGVSFEPVWWRRAAKLGWTALLVPEELGGGSVSGDGVADLAMVAEQLGKTVTPGPLYPVSTVLAGLVDGADPQSHEATIDSLISGETVASWAVYEPGQGWAPHAPSVTATLIPSKTNSGYRIDGVKDRVEAGAQSSLLLVVAKTADGVGQFLVPTDAPGVRIEPQQSIDLVKQYARVHFDGVVDPGAAIGGGAGLIDRQSQIAQVLQCAEVVGILQTVFDFTVAWALDRHTFGRPLASYQALKHRFADMKMWLEACRATTAAAVAATSSRSPDAALSASIAKSYVGEMATDIIQGCVQMHGGIGVTWEHDLHLYLRRAALYRSMFGTPEEHNLRVYQLQEAGQQTPRSA